MSTLFIGACYSRCGACNRNADPHETTHTMETMQGEGCGAEFTATAPSMYMPGLNERIQEMRPDLPFVG